MRLLFTTLTLTLLLAIGGAQAQTTLRANAIGWGGGIINLGAEQTISDKFTVVLEGYYSPTWHTTDFKLDGFIISPELRYYFCMAQRAHHIGLGVNYANYSQFQPTGKRNIRDGQGFSVGLSYGYTWYLSHHWNFDAFIGAGWWHTKNDIYCRTQPDCVVGRGVVEDTFNITRLGGTFCFKF